MLHHSGACGHLVTMAHVADLEGDEILNHSTPTQTLTYMGRMADDVTKAYGNAI